MKKIDSDIETLLQLARSARDRAVAPYSLFKVGAVVRTASGNTYTGCNIENATFSLTICAERLAVFKSLSEGSDKITHVAIVADTPGPCFPCGSCRQILSEFASTAIIVCANLQDAVEIHRIKDLLPHAFGDSDVRSGQ